MNTVNIVSNFRLPRPVLWYRPNFSCINTHTCPFQSLPDVWHRCVMLNVCNCPDPIKVVLTSTKHLYIKYSPLHHTNYEAYFIHRMREIPFHSLWCQIVIPTKVQTSCIPYIHVYDTRFCITQIVLITKFSDFDEF